MSAILDLNKAKGSDLLNNINDIQDGFNAIKIRISKFLKRLVNLNANNNVIIK